MIICDIFVIYSNLEETWVTTLNSEEDFLTDMINDGYDIENQNLWDREEKEGPLQITSSQPGIWGKGDNSE